LILKESRGQRKSFSSSPVLGLVLMVGRTENATHPSAAHSAVHASASLVLVLVAALLATLGDDPRGTLTRDSKSRWNGREVERLTNEITERDDKFRSLDRPAGDELACGAGGELDLLFGSQQDDVRERGFDGVADAPCAVAEPTA
jgi:hypothetical protein